MQIDLEKIKIEIKGIQEIVMLRFVILILPFAGISIVFASKNTKIHTMSLFWITLAVITARNAGMLLDRYIDRNIDKKNPITKNRAIPQKRVSTISVWEMIIINLGVMAFSAYRLNLLCFYLSPIAVIFLTAYPYMKRYSFFSHFFLGLILSLAPIGAWIAIKGTFNMSTLLLGLSVIFWVAGFDIMYHLEDVGFYTEENLYSIPKIWGVEKAKKFSMLLYFLSVLSLIYLGISINLKMWYFVGIGFGSAAMIYQHFFFKNIVNASKMLRKNKVFFLSNMAYSFFLFFFTLLNHFF